MNRAVRSIVAVAGLAALSGGASGGVALIDGVNGGAYGPALALQGNPTHFGDNNLGLPDFANGSELDGGYGVISGGTLYLMLAGNLESNFNKLEIFIDSIAGGQNKLRGDNPDIDFNGLNRMGDDGSGNGLMFDNGFEADYFITVTGGNTGGGYQLFANHAELLTNGGGIGTFLGGSGEGNRVLNGALGITIGIDNSNTGGVDGANVNDPSSVNTGIELAIPLSAIGLPAGAVRVSTFINGSGHDFVSNQVLGSLPAGFGNLGEPRTVNFKDYDGLQYFTVVPGPGAIALGAFAGLSTIRRRRA